MISGSLKQVALRNAQPLSALLELTYRCRWRCRFCFNPRHHDERALSGEEWETVLGDLRTLGTLTVTLSGGDPLAHPAFFGIAGRVTALRMALRVFTNGAFVDDVRADLLADLRPGGVELSLHGATPDVHDASTATPGSFEVLLAAIGRLTARGVRVLLKTPLTRLNEHQLDAMIALARQLGVPYQVDPNITPRDDGDLSPLELRASPDGLLAALRHQALSSPPAPLQRSIGSANCGLGRISLAVDPEGNVYPCPQWRHQSLGNVRTTPLRDLWHASQVRAEAARISIAANDALVASGAPLARLEFCPALAFQTTGDPLVPDAAWRARAELTARLQDGLP